MTRPGVPVDELVPGSGIAAGVATGRLVESVTGDGSYHAVRVGPDRLQFARTFRPTWASAAGWGIIVFGLTVAVLAFVETGSFVTTAGSFAVGLIGIAFFFVKTTETCLVLIEEDHRGTRLRLSGRLDRDALGRLRSAFTDPVAAAASGAAEAAVGAPVASAYDSPAAVAPAAEFPPVANQAAPHAQSWTPPAWNPAPGGLSSGLQNGNGVALEPAPSPTSPPVRASQATFVAVLDDGRRIHVGDLVLIGRDPECGPEESGAELVSVDDPQRSVSKTHLALGSDGQGVWVTDRNSTNGTKVVDIAGGETVVAPGTRVRVGPESSLVFGVRVVTFEHGPNVGSPSVGGRAFG